MDEIPKTVKIIHDRDFHFIETKDIPMSKIYGIPINVMILPKENPILGVQKEIIGYEYESGKPIFKKD